MRELTPDEVRQATEAVNAMARRSPMGPARYAATLMLAMQCIRVDTAWPPPADPMPEFKAWHAFGAEDTDRAAFAGTGCGYTLASLPALRPGLTGQ
ncbi:hypothetical protein ACFXG4_04905 [Nocardia sp. NPDC059246]|uniref:hypothetical protein n=1 Tax=unclassified Nocardia TaxID=2637762 RepID=UPI0036CB412A